MKYFFLTLICFPLILQAQDQSASNEFIKIYSERDSFFENQRSGIYEDVRIENFKKELAFEKDLLKRLQQIDTDQLNPTEKINYQVFSFNLRNAIALLENEMYLLPYNAEGGFYNRLTFTVNRTRLRSAESIDRYLDRLRYYPKYMRQNMDLLKIGIDQKFTGPELIAKNYKSLISEFLSEDFEHHLLVAPFAKRPETIDEATWNTGLASCKNLIQDSILSIYREFDHFMEEEYLPACYDQVGISQVPDGKKIYEQRIAFFTTLNMTPDDVFERGQQEVARIKAEMQDIIDSVGFEGSFEEFIEYLRTDEQFYVKSGEDLLKEASFIAKKVDGLLPRYFNTLPRQPYGVQPVPEAIAPTYTSGRYSGGSFENGEAGNYWVNLYKLSSRPLYTLPALTLHEAVPGHHLQIALAKEMEGLPKFRNRTYFSAFGEGWALYTEWLGKEMGIYRTPYEDFGRLTYEMWRACRLVVDVGLHYKGWTREEAYEFLAGNTALSEHECNTEIDRYIGWPGQAVSYKIGELKIRDLRETAEKKLGDLFDIKGFHEVILKNGSIPLYILEEQVNQYIQETLSASKKRS